MDSKHNDLIQDIRTQHELYETILVKNVELILTELLTDIAKRSPKHKIEFVSGMGSWFVTVNDEIVHNYQIIHRRPVYDRYEKHFEEFYKVVDDLEDEFFNDTGLAVNRITLN